MGTETETKEHHFHHAEDGSVRVQETGRGFSSFRAFVRYYGALPHIVLIPVVYVSARGRLS